MAKFKFKKINLLVVGLCIWAVMLFEQANDKGACDDIEFAMHCGRTAFEEKVPEASIIRLEQYTPILPEDHRLAEQMGGIYFFEVYYYRFGKMHVGEMGVSKANCDAFIIAIQYTK